MSNTLYCHTSIGFFKECDSDKINPLIFLSEKASRNDCIEWNKTHLFESVRVPEIEEEAVVADIGSIIVRDKTGMLWICDSRKKRNEFADIDRVLTKEEEKAIRRILRWERKNV